MGYDSSTNRSSNFDGPLTNFWVKARRKKVQQIVDEAEKKLANSSVKKMASCASNNNMWKLIPPIHSINKGFLVSMYSKKLLVRKMITPTENQSQKYGKEANCKSPNSFGITNRIPDSLAKPVNKISNPKKVSQPRNFIDFLVPESLKNQILFAVITEERIK